MMCGHVFMYYNRDHIQRHRPVWQCGTCGRVSSVPLDCCTRPDVVRQHPGGLTHLLSQWVNGWGRWTLARVRPLWGWQGHLAIRASMIPATASPQKVSPARMMVPTVDRDESLEGEDVVVAAGERL